MTEATQRPWHYDTAEYEIRSTDSDRHTIGRFHAGRHDDGNRMVPRKADAELIVKAVNNHDALVEAVDNFVTWIDSPDLEWGGVPETPELVALRAALEQVK